LTDEAGNESGQSPGLSVSLSSTPQAGDAVISLGSGNGQLIAPIQADGKWYYFWDRNSSGTVGAGDSISHESLQAIFKYESTITSVGSTSDTYRYALLNDIKVALPTLGVTMTPNSFGFWNPGESSSTPGYEPGTSVNSGSTINSTYNDLLAIWDAYNGSGTSTPSSGIPAPWLQPADWPNKFSYWSSSQEVISFTRTPPFYHAIDLYTGVISSNSTGSSNPQFTVLEFVGYVSPVI
jgi:hypothetical protein